ncbi:MAG TPA: DUF1549 and DUF1553 domain-containing protein [Verrucomicrobiales bacterium]|nr:DUF1549 and DUF1553 domain-containing protein [Verrucomicrobiales bacterium]
MATFVAAAAPAQETLTLLPRQAVLHGLDARQQFLAFRLSGEEITGEAGAVEWTSSNPDVVAVEAGVAVARANGEAVVTARSESRTAEARVEVTGAEASRPVDFHRHVLPALSKAGCNSGACHGALAGKGGFRLSLRAYDPEADYRAITREARGRRIEPADPGRSLLLAKPTTAVRHKGGKRLKPGSRDYDLLADWITAGSPPPQPDDPQLTRLEILPDRSVLRPGQSFSQVVRAFYSDGREEDVTRWTLFSSAEETVAQVGESGRVTVSGPGEGAVIAWFSSRIVVSRITAAYPNDIPESTYTEAPRNNFLDDLILSQLRSLRLPPSPPCDDAEFLRRSSIDAIGTLPSAQETRAFLSDPAPDRRERWVDRLLARDEFVDYWAYKWSDVLLVNGHLLRPEAVRAYYGWIRERVRLSAPWDEFVREILTAKGDSFENGATNFYAVHQDPESLAENVSQAFLSLSINCAKCHNHPLEKWTNDQYYAFANLFARVRTKGWGGEPRSGDGRLTLSVGSRGDLLQPRTGRPQPPTPLDGEPLPLDAEEDRRVALAGWLTSPANPYFSRAIANRIWANFFGTGLVEPVDDLRVSNPPSNPALLDAVSDYLIAQDYDLRALMGLILKSAAYQRSSRPLPGNRDDRRHYSRYYPRRLMAEVLLDAVAQSTGLPGEFTTIDFPGGDQQPTDFYPEGTRALELFDSAVESRFLTTFGRNERAITCECERSNEPSMVQALHLSNGDTIDRRLTSEKSPLTGWIAAGWPGLRILEEMYLRTVSRFPTPEETDALLAEIAQGGEAGRRAVLEDIFWALLTSREFLFTH